MYSALEVLCVIYEVLCVVAYVKKLYGTFKPASWQTVVMFLLGGAGFLLLRLLPVTPFVRFGYIVIVMTFAVKPLFGAKLGSGFYGAMLLMTMISVSNVISAMLIMLIGFPADTIMKPGLSRTIALILNDVFLTAIVMVVVKVLKTKADIESPRKAAPLLLAQLCGFYISTLIFMEFLYNGLAVTKSVLIMVVGMLLIDIMLFIFVDRLRLAAEVRRQSALDSQQMAAQFEYFEQLKQDQEETRVLWHDIGKYLNTMHELLERRDLVQARQCIDQVARSFGDIGRVVDVGNTVVSAVLNHTVQKARYMGLEIVLDVRVPSELAVAPADLSVIVGATCDSVLETAARLKGNRPKLTVQMVLKNDILFYEVRLRSESALLLKTGLKERLGLRLSGVKRSVDRYDGTMRLDGTSSAYVVTVSLNIPPENGRATLSSCAG